MDATGKQRTGEQKGPAATPASPALHRVCIQCNNMFRVPTEKFDAKQCPKCRKG
jgi:hypothetical protein